MGGRAAAAIRAEIQRARQLTSRPLGVNLLLPFVEDGQIETCLDERVVADVTMRRRGCLRAGVR